METFEPPAPWIDMETCRTDAPCTATALSQSTSSQHRATDLVDLDLLYLQFLVDDPEAYLEAPGPVEISALGPSSPNLFFATPPHNQFNQPSPPVVFSETINPTWLYSSNENPCSVAPPSNQQPEFLPPAELPFPGIGSDSLETWYTTPPTVQEDQTYQIDWEDSNTFLQSQSQEVHREHGLENYQSGDTLSVTTTSERLSFEQLSFILPRPPPTSAETGTVRSRTPTPPAAPATPMVAAAPRRRRKKRSFCTQSRLISSASRVMALFKETIFTVERGNCDAEGVANCASKSSPFSLL
jgi:hypothetical protein